MDALTHTCSGILIGQALRPLSTVRRQTLVVLGLAALAPDVDVISYLWGAELYSGLHHAYTHTIIGVAVLTVMLAGIERTWVRGIGVRTTGDLEPGGLLCAFTGGPDRALATALVVAMEWPGLCPPMDRGF